jgi:hypothetical protein
MDDRDVVVGIGPVGMGRADVDVGFGRHAGVADAVGAAEVVEAVLAGHAGRVAEVLDQLERVAHRQDLGALDVLDIVGQRLHVAVEVDAVAEGVLGHLGAVDDLDAERGRAARRPWRGAP